MEEAMIGLSEDDSLMDEDTQDEDSRNQDASDEAQ